MTTIENITENNIAALQDVLTAEQLGKLTITKAGRRYTVTFSMSADAAYAMVNDAMSALVEAGRRRGFPHQSLCNVRSRLAWERRQQREQ